MSDADKSQDPRSSGAGAFPNAPGEADLDNALAAAADLAAGLAKEVRESKPPPPRTPAKDERLALDHELAELERLTHQAAEEIGGEGPIPKRKKKKRPAASVPDFMSEFTGPASENATAGGAEVTADAADTVAGDLLADLAEEPKKERPLDPASLLRPLAADTTPTLPTKAAPPPAHSPAPADGALPKAPPHAAAKSRPDVATKVPPSAAKAQAPAARPIGVVGNIDKPLGKMELSKAAAPPEEVEAAVPAMGGRPFFYPAAERIVTLLEIVDRPFAWVGAPLKQVLGWFAIATVLTSLIALAVALVM